MLNERHGKWATWLGMALVVVLSAGVALADHKPGHSPGGKGGGGGGDDGGGGDPPSTANAEVAMVIGNDALEVMDADGGNRARISDLSGTNSYWRAPVWSAVTGKLLVVGENIDGVPFGIYEVDVATGAHALLFEVGQSPHGEPDVADESPDGGTVAWLEDGVEFRQIGGQDVYMLTKDLFLADRSGSGRVQLTDAAAEGFAFFEAAGFESGWGSVLYSEPSWSPNSNQVVCRYSILLIETETNEEFRYVALVLLTIGDDGSGNPVITDRIDLTGGTALEDGPYRRSAWKPDGNAIAVPTGDAIWLIDLLSGSVSKPTDGIKGAFEDVTFSPDGSKLMYTSRLNGKNGGIFTLETATGAVTRIGDLLGATSLDWKH